MGKVVDKTVKLNLVGLDGNAYNLMGRFRAQARREKWTSEEIDLVMAECQKGNYDDLVYTLIEHCDMSSDDDEEDQKDEEEITESEDTTSEFKQALEALSAEFDLLVVNEQDPVYNYLKEDIERLTQRVKAYGENNG
jgi:uncharacterized protein YhaN